MKLDVLEQRIGYSFIDTKLPERALTHSSAAGAPNNERLEFLGDAVLELCVSEYLFALYPDYAEGLLTRMRADLVCEASLCAWAKAVGLGALLRMGRSEEMSAGREKPSILADAAEAVLGAVFADGGIEAGRALVRRMIEYISEVRGSYIFVLDAKTELQQLLQAAGEADISYKITGEVGPPHDRTFYAAVYIDGREAGRGCGHSKKQAEQCAAGEALIKIGNKGANK